MSSSVVGWGNVRKSDELKLKMAGADMLMLAQSRGCWTALIKKTLTSNMHACMHTYIPVW